MVDRQVGRQLADRMQKARHNRTEVGKEITRKQQYRGSSGIRGDLGWKKRRYYMVEGLR